MSVVECFETGYAGPPFTHVLLRLSSPRLINIAQNSDSHDFR